MKKVIVEPFLSFKLSEEALSNIDKQTNHNSSPKKVIKDSRKRVNVKGANSFIVIDPENGEGFSTIPLIHDNHFFTSKFPNPIQLYFDLAFKGFHRSENLLKNITIKPNHETHITFIEEELFNEFLSSKISTIIFLHSTLESFINNYIPDDYIFTIEKKGVYKDLNKEQILREVSIKDKFQKILPDISGLDLKQDHKKIYDDILSLISIRNELIHLKIKKLENNLHYHGEVENIINLKLGGYLNSVQNLLSLIKPNFLKIEDLNKQYFEVNFSTYTAFRLDISIFLELLKSSYKNIKLVIPYSNEKAFKQMKDWIMQNLEIMRANDLLRITESNFSEIGDLIICLEKTDKGYLK